jgi:hypothetical protein
LTLAASDQFLHIVAPSPFNEELPLTLSTSVEAAPLFTIVDIPPQFTLTNQEQRSLEYFRLRTAPQLTGFFDTGLWDVAMLQAANHVPAIQHALIAVGSIHERFEAKDPSIFRSNFDREKGGFALQQYVKAIRGLTDPQTRQNELSLDVALMSCVLFTCFEVTFPHPI